MTVVRSLKNQKYSEHEIMLSAEIPHHNAIHSDIVVRMLLMSAILRNTSAVKKFLKDGADVNSCDQEGNTALIYASDSPDISVPETLIKSGADVNLANKEGHTPIFIAVGAVNDNVIDTVQLLIDHGANVNTRDLRGRTPLFMTLNEMVCKILVHAGADPNIADNSGNTALHHASLPGNVSLIRALLDAGADYNIKNKRGQTPIDLMKGLTFASPEIKDIIDACMRSDILKTEDFCSSDHINKEPDFNI